MENNLESIQLLNTAIIKSKEKKINTSYEERLNELCNSSAIDALNQAIDILSKDENVSRDQAAILLVNTIRDLDNIWQDYVMMEGIDRLKGILNTQH